MEAWREEIERAVDNVRRIKWDKDFRRAWHKAGARKRWTADRKTSGLFISSFAAKYPKAAECLEKGRDVLLTFCDFPAEHWVHLRSTEPIESTFATVRLRTRRTKGCGSRVACLTMVFKLVQCAERHWRALNGSAVIPEVMEGVPFADGVRKEAA